MLAAYAFDGRPLFDLATEKWGGAVIVEGFLPTDVVDKLNSEFDELIAAERHSFEPKRVI